MNPQRKPSPALRRRRRRHPPPPPQITVGGKGAKHQVRHRAETEADGGRSKLQVVQSPEPSGRRDSPASWPWLSLWHSVRPASLRSSSAARETETQRHTHTHTLINLLLCLGRTPQGRTAQIP